MPEYDDPDKNESTHSLDSEFEGLDVPFIRMNGVKKAITATNEKLLLNSTRDKNPVCWFGYDDYNAFMTTVATVLESEKFSKATKDPWWVPTMNDEMHAFMTTVATVLESEKFSEATKDPWWVATMNDEMQVLYKNETWDLVPHPPHKKAIGVGGSTRSNIMSSSR